VDWKVLAGSGANGRVRERDVRAARTHVVAFGVRQPITTRRRVIAERLTASRQQTVPVTLTTIADATKLIALRDQLKSTVGSPSIPSYQDILIKLIANVLSRHLQLAGRWEQDAIVFPRDHELNIGMAVDTEDGLLVPVIQDVNGLTLGALAEKSRGLIERARVGKLLASDMQGGVFTVTNLGAFGIDAFTPVINLPESAILGLGAIRMEPVATLDGKIFSRHQLTLSLTFDHRVIDGAPAAKFLQELVAAIAEPVVT
jgi:pyruvate dehydrogenase E2 component (dihydrolipoamide acetyltransferase)